MIDLNKEQAAKIINTGEIDPGLKKYRFIMSLFNDESTDASVNMDFQKTFKGFYKVRRSSEFCKHYFLFMKNNNGNKGLSFEDTLEHIYDKVKRIEPSFSSKLIATINPDNPIWDSIVLENLGLKKLSYCKDSVY
jgi:hypothetical protein